MENRKLVRYCVAFALLYLTFAIILGAFGAHWLEPHMDNPGTFDTASQYHFMGALAILVMAIMTHRWNFPRAWMIRLFVLGNLLFSGSLYILTFKSHVPSWIVSIAGPITPVGGSLMIFSLFWMWWSWTRNTKEGSK